MDWIRGLLGILGILLLSWLFSSSRKKVNWRLVLTGIFLQFLFAFLVFRISWFKTAFEWIAGFFVTVLDFTRAGSEFLFGGLLETDNIGYLFAFQVLPTVVFFSALTSLLYYLGVLQKLVWAIAWVMKRSMRLSGAESLSAAANIFIGQTEAPLVVKPYIHKMSRSEIMCLMTGGMATIAGGVLAAYVGFLGGDDPEGRSLFATHLLTASVMSAPAAIVMAKILVPETNKVDQNMEINQEKLGTNVLESIANGTTEGLKLAVNVGAMLLVFTALMAMLNYILKDMIGNWTGLNEFIVEASNGRYEGFSAQMILGYVFAPLSWLIGIHPDDLLPAGQLLGEKTVLNEFFAYASFGELRQNGLLQHEKSSVILTYALCGFSNFASIGIQIGGISSIAPNQKTTLSRLGFRALIGGTLACLLTATIAGMFFSS
jgi:CNT family concentrative nucleoside transporter